MHVWRNDIVADSLGNIYVTGQGDGGTMLLKYNSSGDLQWNETWGLDEGYGIVIDGLDNILLTGFYHAYGPINDYT